MRKIIATASVGLALALAPLPLVAQDDTAQAADEAAGLFDGLADAFAVEPLTAEQEARLPQARRLIERVMPPGAMQEMMGGMFGGAFGPMVAAEASDPASVVTDIFGYDVTSSPENAAEVAALIDPVWEERRRREMEALPDAMGRMMAGIEPIMRNVMAELYAIHFTTEELTGIDAFFATPVGATYARKSFSMTSDPRLAASMMQAMPAMMGSASTIEAEMAAVTADLPPVRTYEDLSPAERTRLAELLGIGEEELPYMFVSAADAAAEAIAVDYPYEEFGSQPTQPAAGSVPISKPVR